MSDDKTVTEREAVLRERGAYIRGRAEAGTGVDWSGRSSCLYPLPNPTRLRVLKDPISPNYEWRCEGGVLQWRLDTPSAWFEEPGGWSPLPNRVRMWADLLQNPLEEVTE